MEVVLKEEKKASREADFSLKTYSLCVLIAEKELKEEKKARSSELNIFQDDLVDLDK